MSRLARVARSLRYMKDGPFTVVFGGPVARVLDQALYVGDMEQTIPMLAESTGLSFKTVQRAIERLSKHRLVKRSRKIGGAQTYRFDVKNDLHELIMWAEHTKVK
jgi:DNA-binding transcriptional regulator YhcF (GntR family)